MNAIIIVKMEVGDIFIKYDEYELLELFEAEPLPISEDEAGMFIYSKEYSDGISIMLSFSVYEKTCNIYLSLSGHTVFETEISHVESLKAQNGCLKICTNDSAQNYVIYFKPRLFLKIGLPESDYLRGSAAHR